MDRWLTLQNDIGVFTEKTFPSSTAVSKAKHLSAEALEAAADPSDVLEWADCMILLLDGARKAGFSVDDIHAAVIRKMDINKRRNWGAPDTDGVCRHIEEAA